MKKHVLIGFCATLAACGASPDRLALTPLQSQLELQPLVSSAMVRSVSLPTYAAAEEISLQTPEGLISSNSEILWADDPQRAITLNIARHLSDILNTDVGPDPWPFVDLPDVAIDIRIEQMLAGADGTFRLTGQYYVGGDGIEFPNSVQPFAIDAPVADTGLTGIAEAQSAAILTLSEQIARSLAR